MRTARFIQSITSSALSLLTSFSLLLSPLGEIWAQMTPNPGMDPAMMYMYGNQTNQNRNGHYGSQGYGGGQQRPPANQNNGNGFMGLMMAGSVASNIANAYVQSDIASKMLEAQIRMQQNQGGQQNFVPDDYFPACRLPPAKDMEFSKQTCNPISNPTEVSMAGTFVQVAEAHLQEYKKNMVEGQKVGTPFGIQCLKEQGAKRIKEINQEIEKIKSMHDALMKFAAEQKALVKNDLDQLTKLNNELKGGGQGNLDDATRDFRKYFETEACNEVMDYANLDPAQGLIGVRNTIKQNQTLAQNLQTDVQGQRFHQLIDQDIKKLDQMWKTDVSPGTNLHFQIAGNLFQENQSKLEFQYTQMRERFMKATQGTGINLPATVKEFQRSNEVDSFGSPKWVANVLVENCMHYSSEGISVGRLESLIRTSYERGGERYKSNLEKKSLEYFIDDVKKIYERPSLTVEQKIERIQALEGNSKFSIWMEELYDRPEKNKDWKLTDVLVEGRKHCEKVFVNEPTRVAGSQKSAADYLNEAVQEFKTFQDNEKVSTETFAKAIRDRIFNCQDISYSKGPQSCNAAAFDYKNENFCVPNAQSCAQSTLECLKRADQIVQQKTDEVKKQAEVYNAKVTDLHTKMNSQLEAISALVKDFGKKLHDYFPKADFQAPTNLFLGADTLTKQDAAFGVPVVGNGEILFPEQASQKLTELMTQLQQQTQKIDQSMQQKVATHEKNYQTEVQKWEKFIQQCQTGMMQFQQQEAQRMQAMQRQQYEQMQKQAKGCLDLQAFQFKQGCETTATQLNKDTMTVTGTQMSMMMTPEQQYAMELSQQCVQLTSMDSVLSNDPTGNATTPGAGMGEVNLYKICERNGFNSESLLGNYNTFANSNGPFFAEILNETSQSRQFQPDAIKSYVESGGKNPPIPKELLVKTRAGEYLNQLGQLNEKFMKLSKDKAKASSAGSATKKEGVCEEIQDLVKGLLDPKYTGGDISPETRKRFDDCANRTVMTTGGVAASPALGGDQMNSCVETIIKMEIIQGKKAYLGEAMGVITRLSTLQASVKNTTELRLLKSQNHGQKAFPGCNAVSMMSRFTPTPSPQGAAGGQFFGDRQFNNVSSGAVGR